MRKNLLETKPWIVSLSAILLLLLTSAAQAQTCDRACLKGLADKLIDSMVAHNDSTLPLMQTYAATENSVANSPNSMVIWRTATAAKDHFYVIDTTSHQLFFIVTMAEGASDSLVFGRIKADGQKISEIELFENRSRGQDGLSYKMTGGPTQLPAEWTQTIDTSRLPTRAELLQAGQSMYDTFVSAPPASTDCILLEQGKAIAEDKALLDAITVSAKNLVGKAYIPNADGTVPVPCGGSSPHRPIDVNARVDIIDEAQGIVIARAVLRGSIVPYIVTKPTESVYVPNELLPPYYTALKQQQASEKYNLPAISPMSVTSMSCHLYRIYDGKIQGMMFLFSLAAPGAHSPWDK